MIPRLSCVLFLTALCLLEAAEHRSIPVWPNAVPGASPQSEPEQDTTKASDNLVGGKRLIRLGNVSIPTLTLYEPAGKNTGAAVVVFPGGGYNILALDLEGSEVCAWLNSNGVTCVLLKYRVPRSGPYPKSPAALQDAQRALGLVRLHAAEWHIDPHKVGVWASRPAAIWQRQSAPTMTSAYTPRGMPQTS